MPDYFETGPLSTAGDIVLQNHILVFCLILNTSIFERSPTFFHSSRVEEDCACMISVLRYNAVIISHSSRSSTISECRVSHAKESEELSAFEEMWTFITTCPVHGKRD